MSQGTEHYDEEIRARLERLTDRLRELRRRIDDPEASPTQREADFYFYDEALVSTADMLEVDVPPAARDELSPQQRRQIEDRLAAAGVDLGGAGPPA